MTPITPTRANLASQGLGILNLGAGVQSTALYLMFLRGDITPQIDCAIFADTQEEPIDVYRHLEWLKSLRGPTILTGTAGKLGDHLANGVNSSGGRFAAIPAFTTGTDGVGIMRRQCSKEYKTEVIGRMIRREVLGLKPKQRIPKGVKIVQYLGISLDEAGRARRILDVFQREHKWATAKFPLIERFMTRANCLEWLQRYGAVPHETPRSACVFCPYHTDFEWDRIRREDPAGWARAIEIDETLRRPGTVVQRGLNQAIYLHRSCQPLALVRLDTRPDPRKAQLAMNFAAECMGVCGN